MAKKKKRGGAKNDARGYATAAIAPKPVPQPKEVDPPANIVPDKILPPTPENDDTIAVLTSSNTVETAVPSKRFYKRVEAIYLSLSLTEGVGFTDSQIEIILSNIGKQNLELALETALDWACLHFDTQDLPPILTEGYIREKLQQQENKEQELQIISNNRSNNPSVVVDSPPLPSTSAPCGESGTENDVATSISSSSPIVAYPVEQETNEQEQKVVADDSAKEWILNQYQFDDDNNEEGTDAEKSQGVKDASASQQQQPPLPEEIQLQKLQSEIEDLQATLNDDASNYMRSKVEIKQLQKELGQLKKQAAKWKGKVEKALAARKIAADEDKLLGKTEEDEADDRNDDAGAAVLFGMFDDGEQGTNVATTSESNNDIKNEKEDNEIVNHQNLFTFSSVEPSIPDSWTGKTPKQVLEDYCRKQGILRPNFSKLSSSSKNGCSLKIQFKQTEQKEPLRFEQHGPFFSKNDAEHYLSAHALWELTGPDHLQPFYRLFPPIFASLWKSWKQQEKEKYQNEILSSKAELDDKVQNLINVLPKSLWITQSKAKDDKSESNAVSDSREAIDNKNDQNLINGSRCDKQRNRDLLTEPLRKEFMERHQTPGYTNMAMIRSKLPMHAYRDEILDLIQKNPVTILCAETGAGKTTQCPQFLLEDAILRGKTSINIICTQPRRVAAMSVADRVAEEMCEPQGVGGLVGYSIRMESKQSSKTRLLFCTTGVILRRLQDDPALQGVTHVLVDEVHERQWQIDFLLITLRRMIQTTRPDLKVVLMSATMDAKLFGSFFGEGAPLISVPGRTFPVAEYFLEDLLDATDHIIEADSRYAIRGATSTFKTETLWVTTKGGEKRRETASLDSQTDVSEVSGRYPGYKMSTQRSMDRVDEKVINYDLIEEVLLILVDKNKSYLVPPQGSAPSDDGAILIFLPGLGEIRALSDRLQASRIFGNRNRFEVLPLHSTLSPKDQKRAFRIPPSGCRKIICSTNIAETSVTISDVVAVIDCGLVREVRQDKRYATNKLVLDWCSRASSKQRSGRAGRVQEGICCKLFSRLTMEETMRAQAIPELQRVPLEEVCLNILAGRLATNCAGFLEQAPQPPSETSVNLALTLLQEVGALDVTTSTDEKLTPLGHHLAKLPVHVRLGKMLIFGSLFSCLDKALTIAASLSVKSPFSTAFGNESQAMAKHRSFRHELSDFLTYCNVWESFQENQGTDRGRRFCYEHFLSWTALQEIADSRKQFLELLAQLGFARGYNQRSKGDPDEWLKATKTSNTNLCRHSGNDNLVHAVVCAGLYPNVAHVEHHVTNVPALWHKTERLYFHSNSTNHNKRLTRGENWIVFHEKFGTGRRTSVSATAPVLPSAILLFGGDIVIQHMERKATVDDWISLPMSAQTAVRFRELRKRLDQVLLKRLEKSGDDHQESDITNDIVQLLQDSIETSVQKLMQMDLVTDFESTNMNSVEKIDEL